MKNQNIKIVSFNKFFECGSTKPFLAESDGGELFVVKAITPQSAGKILLNEFLTGSLANLISLPWPKTHIGKLEGTCISQLKNNMFEPACSECVVIEYFPTLIKVPWPQLPELKSGWDFSHSNPFPTANKQHLSKYFDQPERQNSFYGKSLFELWLLFEDTKYDTLFALPNRTPMFIDGSHAFCGSDWEYDQLSYSQSYSFPMSPYLEGVLKIRELFDDWIIRIDNISESQLSMLLKQIPFSWGINSSNIDFLYYFLTKEKQIFIEKANCSLSTPRFISWLENNEDESTYPIF